VTLLDHAPATHPALVDAASGEVVTFGELRARSVELVAPIGAARSLVLLLAGNDVFTASVYAGLLGAGHPVVLLDPQTTGEPLAGLVESYRPSWVAGPVGTATRLSDAEVDVDGVITAEGGELVALAGVDAPALHPDLAVLLTTSGTTGSRKLVRLSTANVEANARSIAEALGLTSDERPLTSLPVHYSFGLSVLNSHWSAGAAVVLTGESVMQKSFWELIDAQQCTSLAGVPFTFQMLERTGFRDRALPSLTTLQQAGGALDRTLTERYAAHMAARGGRLFVMYGQTEATARMAYLPPERLTEKLGSAGIAIPGGSFSIDHGDAADANGSDGEVVYTGPNVMLGYATAHDDLARGDDLGGVLHTGDLGRLDDDGYLFLTGRSARIAKVFGLRLNLDDVERVLREHGPAATVGGPDVVWGFCAFGTDESLAEDARRLARLYRIHPSALKLRRVDEIPATSSGKVDYERVRQWTS
jgi:acyl-CoA synthetase (AMP-forming)/AMP-acid ligase II